MKQEAWEKNEKQMDTQLFLNKINFHPSLWLYTQLAPPMETKVKIVQMANRVFSAKIEPDQTS